MFQNVRSVAEVMLLVFSIKVSYGMFSIFLFVCPLTLSRE